ncbi:hypothetical protein BDZ91DRAFT_750572 [Kalaharituber pfeilii]|nr:hypothetical protein BDZ91DRAFT_750572 [Kalaharituber pfeilii]
MGFCAKGELLLMLYTCFSLFLFPLSTFSTCAVIIVLMLSYGLLTCVLFVPVMDGSREKIREGGFY